MKRIYPIFVPDKSIDKDEIEHEEVVNWCYRNLEHENVLILSLDDVYLLQYDSEILDIINEENNDMLQVGEDTWIINDLVKLKIRERLIAYNPNITDMRIKEINTNLLRLLSISIVSNKHLYFIF